MARNARSFVAGLGALVYALVGGRLLLSSFQSALTAVRDYNASSGGIGAVSIGVSLALVELVLPVLAIIVNRLLAPWARRSDAVAKALHRAQLWALVFALVAVFADSVFLVSAALGFVLLALSGVLWAIAFLLTAALLVTYARRTATPVRTS